MPLEYPGGTLSEHMACRQRAAVFDVSHLGTVRLAGGAAFERLQGALSNDLRKIGPGRAQYTHLLDEDGGIVDDIIVWWVDEGCFDVMPNASNTSRVVGAIGGEDITADRAVLAVQGPHARRLLARVFPEAAGVRRFGVARLGWHGAAITVAGTGYTGEDGLECAVPAQAAADLWEAVVKAGVAPAGLGARDTLRLEAGLPLHGHDLGPGTTPLEAGLAWVVGWDKPSGFTGRSALMAQRTEGARRVLRGIAGEGRQPLRTGYRAYLGGEDVGELSSGNFSPVLGRGIGLCYLPSHVDFGTAVEVDARGRRLPAVVARLPFVKGGPPVPLEDAER